LVDLVAAALALVSLPLAAMMPLATDSTAEQASSLPWESVGALPAFTSQTRDEIRSPLSEILDSISYVRLK
jgi:hypothetical protein